jgi:DNA polymerase-3 subunit alpha
MAFVKIEDKMGEIEVIVFPKLYETIGAKLVQDAVIKVTGKVNATDRDGNKIDEAKVNAEEIVLVTDEELDSYESTGATLKVPTKGVAQKKYGKSSASKTSGDSVKMGNTPKKTTTFKTSENMVDAKPIKAKKMFVRIMDASDKDGLVKLKQVCTQHPGLSEVILVIGPDKKAMRMPFRCEIEDDWVKELKDIFAEENVVVK